MEKNNLNSIISCLKKNMEKKHREMEAAVKSLNRNINVYHSVMEGCLLKSLFKQEDVFEVVCIPEMNVISIRKRYSCNIEEMFVDRLAELYRIAEDNNIEVKNELTAVFHSGYSNQFEDCYGDLETFLPVSGNYDSSKAVKKIPMLTGVKGIFLGKYTDMLEYYKKMEQWAFENNISLSGRSFEVYKIGPDIISDESEYVTEIILEILQHSE